MLVAVLADCHIDHGHHGGRWADHAWDAAISQVITADADVAVLAGDVFHTGRPTVEAMLLCAEGAKRLTGAGIEVVYVCGNHEWSGVSAARGHRPPPALLGELPGVRAVTDARTLRLDCGLALACLPWPGPHRGHPAAAQTEDAAWIADECSDIGGPVLAVAHAMVAGARLGSECQMAAWQPGETAPLDALDVPDVWRRTVLGHVHARQPLSDTCSYVGGLDCYTFADEGREGGWCLYEWDDASRSWSEEWHKAGETRFATIRHDESPDHLPEGCIVRVHLTDGATAADCDESTLAEAGLMVAGYIHDDGEDSSKEAVVAVTEAELAELAPEALLDRWAAAHRLDDRDRERLHAASREVLDWG